MNVGRRSKLGILLAQSQFHNYMNTRRNIGGSAESRAGMLRYFDKSAMVACATLSFNNLWGFRIVTKEK